VASPEPLLPLAGALPLAAGAEAEAEPDALAIRSRVWFRMARAAASRTIELMCRRAVGSAVTVTGA
jgi:hypothetical protein